jgi:nitrogen-specific signal transduction histidine kinase
VHDRTQELLLRQKQKELDRTVFWSEMAKELTHALRNPLTSINTFAQLLPELFADPDFRSSYSNTVIEDVGRINAITKQIETFASQRELNVEPLQIREVLQKGIDLARFRVHPNGVDIKIRIADDLPAVLGDPNALAECFSHVVANALEALKDREKPFLEIDARKTTREGARAGVEVVVHDNGGGIPPELRENVFSPFATSKDSGMGLGLPMAQRTVTDHNGDLHIDTGASGTTVTIVLPTGVEPQGVAA